MLEIDIPGFKQINIEHVVFDYNGTIAQDGKLIKGIKQGIDQFSMLLKFHVITADTFGFVKKELDGIDTKLIIIPKENQAQAKLDYINTLGKDKTMSVGNGANDRLMLEQACVGIAVLQNEGLALSSLLTADLLVKDILDVFDFFRTPERLVASLRT